MLRSSTLVVSEDKRRLAFRSLDPAEERFWHCRTAQPKPRTRNLGRARLAEALAEVDAAYVTRVRLEPTILAGSGSEPFDLVIRMDGLHGFVQEWTEARTITVGKLRLKVLPRDRILSLTLGTPSPASAHIGSPKPPQRILHRNSWSERKNALCAFPAQRPRIRFDGSATAPSFARLSSARNPVPAANQAPGNALPLRA